MAKKTYECQMCGALVQVDEGQKEPRCTMCTSSRVTEIPEEELQALLNPASCGFR